MHLPKICLIVRLHLILWLLIDTDSLHAEHPHRRHHIHHKVSQQIHHLHKNPGHKAKYQSKPQHHHHPQHPTHHHHQSHPHPHPQHPTHHHHHHHHQSHPHPQHLTHHGQHHNHNLTKHNKHLISSAVAEVVAKKQGYRIKVFGGEPVEDSGQEFPYIVALKSKHGDKASFCAGSIIQSNIILTAAHCVKKKEPKSLLIQPNYQNMIEPSPDAKLYHVSKIIAEPNYIRHTFDIALVILTEAIPLGEKFCPANLPTKPMPSASEADEELILPGWGKYEKGYPTHLLFAHLPLLNDTVCRKNFGKYFRRDHFCAGGPGLTSCYGDSGGPLVVKGTKDGCNDTQVGIVAFSQTRCVGKPSVFTDVYKYLDWIKNVMKENEPRDS